MSADRNRVVGLTGARFGRVDRDVDVEPEGATDPDTDAPEQPAPDQSDQRPPSDAVWSDDVDDLPRPIGARFARAPRESRRSRRAAQHSAPATPAPAVIPPTPEAPAAWPQPPPAVIHPEPEPDESAGADLGVWVRPYIFTGGRTRSRLPLPLESLVTTVPGACDRQLFGAHRAVLELCRASQSVAEVSARLAVPLGVARVLVDDLAAENAVIVHGETVGDSPDLELMGRVLAGLRRL